MANPRANKHLSDEDIIPGLEVIVHQPKRVFEGVDMLPVRWRAIVVARYEAVWLVNEIHHGAFVAKRFCPSKWMYKPARYDRVRKRMMAEKGEEPKKAPRKVRRKSAL